MFYLYTSIELYDPFESDIVLLDGLKKKIGLDNILINMCEKVLTNKENERCDVESDSTQTSECEISNMENESNDKFDIDNEKILKEDNEVQKREIEKLNAIIDDLRKENEVLKGKNIKLENEISVYKSKGGNNFYLYLLIFVIFIYFYIKIKFF